jgi:hypothetical protein
MDAREFFQKVVVPRDTASVRRSAAWFASPPKKKPRSPGLEFYRKGAPPAPRLASIVKPQRAALRRSDSADRKKEPRRSSRSGPKFASFWPYGGRSSAVDLQNARVCLPISVESSTIQLGGSYGRSPYIGAPLAAWFVNKDGFRLVTARVREQQAQCGY